MPKLVTSEAPSSVWFMHACSDYFLVRVITVGLQSPVFHHLAVYHAHQCAEKCLKAVLVHKTGKYARTHDLEELFQGCTRAYQSFNDELTRELIKKLAPLDEVARYGIEARKDPLRTEVPGVKFAGVYYWGTPLVEALDYLVRKCHDIITPQGDHDMYTKALRKELDTGIGLSQIIRYNNRFVDEFDAVSIKAVANDLRQFQPGHLVNTPNHQENSSKTAT